MRRGCRITRLRRTYFATPVASVLAVDEEGVSGWTLKTLHTVPVRLWLAFVCW